MKFFIAKTTKGLIIRCIISTYIFNVLLAPFIYIASLLPGKGFIPNLANLIIVLVCPYVFSILWGNYLRRKNRTLLTGDSAQRELYSRLAILTALAAALIFLLPEWWMVIASVAYDITTNLFLQILLIQLVNLFNVVSVLLSLTVMLFCKKPKMQPTVVAK